MRRRVWAAALAAAVTLTSAVTIPYEQARFVMAAPQSTATEVSDTSTDGRTTAGGFTFRITGKEATITGYNGGMKELAIPTKIS